MDPGSVTPPDPLIIGSVLCGSGGPGAGSGAGGCEPDGVGEAEDGAGGGARAPLPLLHPAQELQEGARGRFFF